MKDDQDKSLPLLNFVNIPQFENWIGKIPIYEWNKEEISRIIL
jgi:hypothetical protein